MKLHFRSRTRRGAQTLVFFLLAWGMIMLLCGLAIDSGLLYLAKAKLGRAVDGAALAAVGNFNRDPDPATNRGDVAKIMRNFAVANFTDLSAIGTTPTPAGGTSTTATLPNGTTSTTYTYTFTDGVTDTTGIHQLKRYVQVTLTTGSGGAITSARCDARCPVQTYFIGYATYAINGNQNVKIGGYTGYKDGDFDLKVSSSAIASRHPRLIMVVIDRSASMLQPGGGASGLPPAVVQFLDFFDTSSDNIGIVSFGSSARLEVPMTTNFIIAGTNNLTDAYNLTNDVATPGIDPEMDPTRGDYEPNYNTTGIRRLKFGGDTAADDGIRLALEQLMANAGFTDPDVVKYMVIFTDGAWNATRTMVAAPGYTNTVTAPTADATHVFSNNWASSSMTNGQATGGPQGGGPWDVNVANDTNLVPVPTLSPLPYVMGAMTNPEPASSDFADLVQYHTNDTWISADSTSYEPLGSASGTTIIGAPLNVVTTSKIGTSVNGLTNYYAHNLDVWLQPGSVDYYYHLGLPFGTYVSDYTNPTKHINIYLNSGDSNVLVVPGYVTEGVVFDGLDLTYPDNTALGVAGYPCYRTDNYQLPDMWPDNFSSSTDASGNYYTGSLQRELMFRNYANLLTGFYVFRPDEPVGAGFEPLITEQNPPGAPRSRYGLGAYYPSAGFYWPFGGELTNSADASSASGYVTNAVGIDQYQTFGLQVPTSGSNARNLAYSINMLSSNAAPEWSGELFYMSTSGAGTNTVSGNSTTSASQIMHSSDWQNGAPPFVTAFGGISGLMLSEATHNTTIVGSPSVWRPAAFNGSVFSSVSLGGVTRSGSSTGGWVSDGNGHYYPNAMAWSGRPTHYFDFSQAKWIPIANNHAKNVQFLQLGNWKAWEYAWHARALGVTIYTIGYGTLVSPDQCAFLAQLANATNSISPGSPLVTNASAFNPSQPIGQQFYATNSTDISNDFFLVGQAINAALTQ
jgi:Flp pilus assembly protein TadG